MSECGAWAGVQGVVQGRGAALEESEPGCWFPVKRHRGEPGRVNVNVNVCLCVISDTLGTHTGHTGANGHTDHTDEPN